MSCLYKARLLTVWKVPDGGDVRDVISSNPEVAASSLRYKTIKK